MNACTKRITSAFDFPRGEKSEPPLPPPIGRVVSEFLNVCSKGKELQDRKVHRCVETDTAFVRADCVVMLNTVTHIGLNITFIVHPSHTELIYSIRNTQTFDQVYFIKLRMFVVFFFNSRKYFFYCLMIPGSLGNLLFRSSNTFAAFIIFFFFNWLI